MVLYQFYNADLLDIPNKASKAAAAYVDDAILIATAATFSEAHKSLTDMMMREGGAMDWAKSHNSSFELSKLALMDFAHQAKKVVRAPIQLQGIDIKPAASTKYLGVILDQNLNWKEQEANTVRKGAIWAAQIRRAVRSEWGLTPKHVKRLYMCVAILRTLYAVDTWCAPPKHHGTKRTIGKLKKSQRAGTLAITGGLRTTPTDSLDVHTNVLPAHLEVNRHCS